MYLVKKIDVIKTYKRTIEKQKIENTPYSYFKDTIIETCNGKSTFKTIENVTLDEYINAATGLECIKTLVPVPKMYKGHANIIAIKKDDLNRIQSGEVHVTDIMYKAEYQCKPIKEDEMLVLWNSGSHKICDLNQNFIPLPIKIGYINGSLSSDKYDLNKVLELVKNNKNVLNRKNVEITNIPYYNCWGNHTHSIEFKYLADFDEYQKLMEIYQKNSLDLPFYIVDEVIGAKQFRRNDY